MNTTILQEIQKGEHDALLDQISLASQQRRRALRSLQLTPATERFINSVETHPGLTALELAALLDCSVQRIYQLEKQAKERIALPNYEEYPRKFYPRKPA